MAIGTTAAILGSAAIGAGASVMSSNAQKSAAKSAANTASQTADQQTALHRDIFNQQVQLNEPFRQADIQRQNMLLEMFGGTPVGQPQAAGAQPGNAFAQGSQGQPDYAAYVNNSGGLSNAFNTLSAANENHIMQQGYDWNGNGRVDGGEYGGFHYDRHGQGEGRLMPMVGASTPPNNYVGSAALTNGNALSKQPVQDVITTATPTAANPANPAANDAAGLAPTVDPSVAGADRFNNSLFNAAFTNDFNRDRDRIDNALANSGLQFSGARMNAIENSRADNFGNALSNYTNLMAGFPTSSQATNAMTNAAGAYGANASNAMGNAANASMQSAYARGDANANAFNGVGNALGFGLGAFSLGK
jgi:hypothetical protein